MIGVSDRQIVHFDLDSFFVSCTLLKMPELARKPLIIGGSENRGIVMSASDEAVQYGVKKYMPTRLALQRCPDAVVLKGDYDLFSYYSDIVNEIIAEKSPVHERSSLDEFYMDMTGMDRFFGSYHFTKELAGKINSETGLPLTFGLSVNKTVAKMCTQFAPPIDGLTIQKNEVQPFLDPQSIRNLPSIGDVTYRFLKRISIHIIHSLRSLPKKSMFELMGKNGENIWHKANGVDNTPVIPYNKNRSISTELTFDKDTQDISSIKSLITAMVEKLCYQLRKSNMMSSCISVRIRYSNLDTESKQKKIPYSSNDDVFLKQAIDLFENLYNRRMMLRLIGIKLSHFVSGNHQIDIFNDSLKMIKLNEAMDKMKNRYNDPLLIRKANGFSKFEYH